MVRGDIEFVADTLLIEKVIAIDYGIQKSAGVADTLKGALGSGLSTISNAVASSLKNEIDTKDTKTTLESVGNIIATGGLFKLWWPLGVINAVATSFFGVNAVTIAMKIFDIVKSAFEGGKSVTPSDVSDATKAVTAELTSAGARQFDPFEIIRLAEKDGKLFRLIKEAAPSKGGGLFEWIKSLNPFTGKSLIGGFVGWAVKAALLGAGLLAVSGTAANLLGINKKPYESSQPAGAGMAQEPEQAVAPVSAPTGLNPTGNGQGTHNQSPTTKWVVPVPGGSVEQMLLQWAAYVYHDFADQSNWRAISSTASFNKVVEELKKAQESGSDQVTIPSQYKSVKQVVDQFASEAKTKLKESNVKSQ